MEKILVTGGAGYIGSHTCVELLEAGYDVVILDNFCNSKRSVLQRIERITGKRVPVVEGDIRDKTCLDALFTETGISAVIHFAGLKAVGESVANPLWYYENNVHGSTVLSRSMADHGVTKIVFSSSATVYGGPDMVPIREDFTLKPTNPYGHSKLMIEQILRDLHRADSCWNVVLLRYFNPVGAHESGLIGEDPNGIPNNLMPYISQVACGRLARLSVFGDDYPTHDGTGVRDYIHVMDLAKAHVRALKKLEEDAAVRAYNIGTGKGYSVLETISAFERASGKRLPYNVTGRRPGDVAACYADVTLARRELAWEAKRGIDQMCADAWRWQQGQARGALSNQSVTCHLLRKLAAPQRKGFNHPDGDTKYPFS